VKASFCFPAGGSLFGAAGRGLPGGNSLLAKPAKRVFFSSPKGALRARGLLTSRSEVTQTPKVSKRKGDPGCCVPSLRYGQPAVLGPAGVSLNSLRSNNAIPDPSGPALLGASTRGGDRNTQQPNTNTEYLKKQGHAVACPCFSWSSLSIPAPACPVLAGPRSAETSGSGPALSERSEFSRTPLGSSTAGCPKRSVGTQTAGRLFFGDFLLAKQKKVTGRRATPGQQASAKKTTTRTRTGMEGRPSTGGGGTLA
jgi:hypothetical protein